MTLKTKTILILATTLALLTATLYTGARIVILNGFDELETLSAKDFTETVRDGFLSQVSAIDRPLRQYCSWDQTAAFVEGPAPGFAESNFSPAMLQSMGVSLVVVWDASGSVVLARSCDLDAGKMQPMPESYQERIGPASPFMERLRQGTVSRGLVLFDEAPYYLVARHIVGGASGQSDHGMMVMGVTLGSKIIEQGERLLRRDIAICRLDTTEIPESFLPGWLAIEAGQEIASVVADEETMYGYALFRDVQDNPALLLRVTLGREVHKRKALAQQVLLISLLGAGVVFGAVTLWLMERLIVARVARLGREARRIAETPDASRRMEVRGSDELAALTVAINEMLDALHLSRLAVRESEARVRALMNATAESAFLLSPDGVIIAVNEPGARRLGMNSEELAGASIVDLFPPDLARSRMTKVREVAETGRRVRFEDQREGRVFDISLYPVFGLSGKVDNVAVYARDISKRRAAEDALRRSERKYRELIESANSIVLRWDPDGRITFVNGYGVRFFGLRLEELVGKPIIGTIVPEKETSGRDSAEVIDDILSRPGGYVVNDNENLRADGSRAWVAWSNKPVFDDAGELIEILSIGIDITKRREAEEALLHRVEMESRVATISSSFLNLPAADTDKAVRQAMAAVGEFVRADRSYIYLTHDEGKSVDLAYEWCAEGVAPLAGQTVGLHAAHFSWFLERIAEPGVVSIPDVDALPPEAAPEKALFKSHGVKSLVDVPMMWRGEPFGVWGFSSLTEKKHWPEQDISLLKVVGELFVAALKRKEAEEGLRLQNARLDALVELEQMPADTAEGVSSFVLDKAIQLTQSTLGLVGTVSIDQKRIEPQCWSGADLRQCEFNDDPLHICGDGTSLWSQLVFQRKPVVVNDYESFAAGKPSLAARGCPAGHVSVKRFLAVPIASGESVEAVAAVANKEEPYDPIDVNQLTLLMNGAWNLIRRREAMAWIQREIDEIATIQRGFLPGRMPTIPEVDLAATYNTYDRAGGDFYTVFPIGGVSQSEARRWALMIADASGHGPSAAVMTAVLSTLLHTMDKSLSDPGVILDYLNLHVSAKSGTMAFITVFLAILDLDESTLTYACAGHNRPILRDPSGNVCQLDSVNGLPLGLAAILEPAGYASATVTLKSRHALLLYTDGVSETRAPGGEIYTEERLARAFAGCKGSAQDTVNSLMRHVHAFEAGERPSDDQTMMVMQVT